MKQILILFFWSAENCQVFLLCLAFTEKDSKAEKVAISAHLSSRVGKSELLTEIIPFAQTLAKKLPELVQSAKSPIFLMPPGHHATQIISRELVGSLLANALFNTLPSQYANGSRKFDFSRFRLLTDCRVTFSTFYASERHLEPLLCILNYFAVVSKSGFHDCPLTIDRKVGQRSCISKF